MGFINLFLVLIGIHHRLNVGHGPSLPKKEEIPKSLLDYKHLGSKLLFQIHSDSIQDSDQISGSQKWVIDFSEVIVNKQSPLLQFTATHTFTACSCLTASSSRRRDTAVPPVLELGAHLLTQTHYSLRGKVRSFGEAGHGGAD